MRKNTAVFASCFFLLAACLLWAVPSARAVDPGDAYPAGAEAGDQKAGSVLVFPYYTSGTPAQRNTRISLTNTNDAASARLHVFFVLGASGLVADMYVCLAANQTRTFLVSDVDPGVSGYVVAVAVDGNGCPTGFNHIIGDAYVKLPSGHAANIGAYAFSALYSGTLAGCTSASTAANINFDGTSYNMAPRTVAVDKLRSRANGNDTILVLNRMGGNLATGSADDIGAAGGSLFDQGGGAYGFSFTANSPQLVSSLTDTFPVTAPVYTTVIPTGQSGWMKLSATGDFGLIGAVINFNGAAGAASFNGGHGLRALTLTPAASFTIPVFPPPC